MNTYLAIITTVLVVTHVIRVCQNHAQLRRQRIVFEKQIGQLAELEPTKADFQMQRRAYKLIVEYLESKTEHCEWCKPGLETCATCTGFYGIDGCICNVDSEDEKCAAYEPIDYCPHCGIHLKNEEGA